jgi:hypothetical protein
VLAPGGNGEIRGEAGQFKQVEFILEPLQLGRIGNDLLGLNGGTEVGDVENAAEGLGHHTVSDKGARRA